MMNFTGIQAEIFEKFKKLSEIKKVEIDLVYKVKTIYKCDYRNTSQEFTNLQNKLFAIEDEIMASYPELDIDFWHNSEEDE